MSGISNVTLMGNLARDPELRYTPQGTAVCEVTIAVSEKRKGGDEEVSFFDCLFWNRPAEVVAEYCRKGKPLLITGKLKQERWTNKDGANRTKVVIVASGFEFPSRKWSGEEDDERGRGRPPRDDAPPPEMNDLDGDAGGESVPF